MSLDLHRNALEVAPDLLSYNLCVSQEGMIVRQPIMEVEAYHGFDDKASHAHKGMTPRNAIMFGRPGYWYIYLCYGVHWLLNLVTADEGYPSAVLIRGVGSFDGPGKLTRALGIDKRFNEKRCTPDSGLWIEPILLNDLESTLITTSPRIGVAYAGSPWVGKPWRFQRN